MTISRLTKVPLRELWKHEALDFTNWLSENLDFLSEAVGFNVSLVQKEAAAGPFSADILGEDSQGNYVIIENQLEKTDHDHLGKLITYLSNLEAKTAIWITSEPRPEHEAAVHWLNETLPADTAFFLIKLEAYQIDNSPPAPLMTVVAGPSSESKQVGSQKKELAERHVQRVQFWKELLEKYKECGTFFSNISPSKENWLNTGAGKSGLAYSQVVMMDAMRVEVYISTSHQATNKRYYDQLFTQKEKIENAYGKPLDWQRMDDKTTCRISYTINGRGLKDKTQWPEMQDMLIDEMYKLRKAFQPEIDKLK